MSAATPLSGCDCLVPFPAVSQWNQPMANEIDRIEVMTGDITVCTVDAIVNAANETLLGGGGVDGAIHRAAGPQLLKECKKLGGCPTGMAKITAGYRLPAESVIHTVGPIWHGGDQNEEDRLRSCYKTSLALAAEHRVQAVAFPAISTGVYRFPKVRAADIALTQTLAWLRGHELPEKVIFCCFTDDDARIYRDGIASRQG